MKKLHFTITINAPREKVWHVMLDKETYAEWTKPFNAGGSFYKGDWEKGSKMLFIGPDPKTGEEGGMVSQIAEVKKFEYISIKHVGILMNGVEDTTSEMAKKWTPAYENYTFNDKNEATELLIDIETADDFVEMFSDMWPTALQKLKEISERS